MATGTSGGITVVLFLVWPLSSSELGISVISSSESDGGSVELTVLPGREETGGRCVALSESPMEVFAHAANEPSCSECSVTSTRFSVASFAGVPVEAGLRVKVVRYRCRP